MIVFENDQIYCVYKKKGVHTLPSSNPSDENDFCLYRLDKATSGILVFAKNEQVYNKLKVLQQNEQIVKTYKAEVKESNILKDKRVDSSCLLNATLTRPFIFSTYFRPFGEKRQSVRPVLQSDVKKFKNKDVTKKLYTSTFTSFDNGVVTINITSAFRHQIRAHLAMLGYSIVGDTMYGYDDKIGVMTDNIALECVSVKIGTLLVRSA